MTKVSDMTYADLHEAYIKKCKVNNLSEYTINFYKVSLRTFGKFVDIDQLKANEIDRDLIDDYILHLKETGVKDVTINTYTHGISPVIKYGMERGIIRKFSFKDIRTTEEIKETYTKQELEILLKKPSMHSFSEYRNWVIINFLLGTGIRALELRSIRIKDCQLSSGILLVTRTKNRKPRYIPISKTLTNILFDYLEYRKANESEDHLFCNQFGEILARTTLQMGITKYCKKRGIEKYSLHLFRHTFARMWIINHGDIFTLKKILGHSSLKQVNHYANLVTEDIQNGFDEFCPLENFSSNKQRVKITK